MVTCFISFRIIEYNDIFIEYICTIENKIRSMHGIFAFNRQIVEKLISHLEDKT